MNDILDRIVVQLQRRSRPVAGLLLPGLTRPEIDHLTAPLPFLLPEELKTVYEWRNGTQADAGDILGDLHFFPGFYLLSLNEAIECFNERRYAPQWRIGWFPIFADGAGDFYLVRCLDKPVESAEVIGFIHGEPEQSVEYESIRAMMETIAECYETSAFFVDHDGYLEMDDDQHCLIAQKYNPGVKEWQS